MPPSFEVSSTLLFSVFVLNLLLTAKCLLQLLVGKQHRFVWLERGSGLLGCLIACWLVPDGICQFQTAKGLGGFVSSPVLSVAMIGCAVGVSWLNLKYVSLRLPASQLLRSPTIWLLLSTSVGATAWSGQRFYSVAHGLPDAMLDLEPPGHLQQTAGFFAVTDRGRIVRLLNWHVDKEAFENYDFESFYARVGGTQSVISRASPNPMSNCHGWVFTAGMFHMTGGGVERILEDNGYKKVDHPQTEDLIIYRSSQDQIVHTGLVRGVLDDGTVIVESKWSVTGRFLHRPEDQPYSPVFAYYRSPRQGHLVTIKPAQQQQLSARPSANSFAQPPSTRAEPSS